jgi:hypothetical protein
MFLRYAWAELVDDSYLGEPQTCNSGRTVTRAIYEVKPGFWHVVEARPAAPAQRSTGAFLTQQVQQYQAAQAAAQPLSWMDCERISNMPEVHEALQAFSEDSTGDNGVGVVQAVVQALADLGSPAAQQAHQNVSSFNGTPLLVAELAMFFRILAHKVRVGVNPAEIIKRGMEFQQQHGLCSALRADPPRGVKTDGQEPQA